MARFHHRSYRFHKHYYNPLVSSSRNPSDRPQWPRLERMEMVICSTYRCFLLSISKAIPPPYRNPSHLVSLFYAFATITSWWSCALIARIIPIVPLHEIRWTPIVDLAYFIDFGLKAAVTRTGSKDHTLEPTPKWMREQLGTIRDIIAHSSESSQLFATTSIARELRSAVSTSRQIQSAVPLESQNTFSSKDSVYDDGESVRRDPDAVRDFHSRDSSTCVLTGIPAGVVAHIILYSCGRTTESFDTSYFWMFLQSWLGPATARTVWEYVRENEINRLENLACMGAVWGLGPES